jgi:hypothetical protein
MIEKIQFFNHFLFAKLADLVTTGTLLGHSKTIKDSLIVL